MNTLRRILSAFTAILIFISTATSTAFAAEAAEEKPEMIQAQAGSLLIEAESADNYRYEDGHLYIYGGTVSVKTSPAVDYSTDRIEVSGYAELVLNGVRIKAADGAAVKIMPGADVEIRLAEDVQEEAEGEEYVRIIENYLEGAEGYAGIEAGTLPGGENEHDLAADLTIKGNGFLAATGGAGAAGIGGSRGQDACGVIVIEEGNVRAIAGIGADAVGCGADSGSDPVCAPVICEGVSSFLAMSDGSARAVASAAETENDPEENDSEENVSEKNELEDPEFEPACILTAAFAESGNGNLTGLDTVRVRDTAGKTETDFTMPEGYRKFALKVNADSEYMIEQGGRIFGRVEAEDFSGEITESDEADIVFKGTADRNGGCVYLAPVQNVPAIDIDVTGLWEDEEDRDGTRPESVTVTLYANGNETGRSITLSEENDWCGTFDDMALYSDSVRQSYSVVEEKVEGYTGLISGSDRGGYTITNTHDPLPEGRSGEEEIAVRSRGTIEEGRIVATVLTTKVSRSMPARTSTTIKKTKSAKTADSSCSLLWGGLLLLSVAALFIWMRIEQNKE